MTRLIHAEGEFLIPEAPYTLCGVAYEDIPDNHWVHQDMDYVTCTNCRYTDDLMHPEPPGRDLFGYRDEEEMWYFASADRIGIDGYRGPGY